MKALLLLAALFITSTQALASDKQPDHDTWLKKEACEQLRQGMREEDVEKVLGEASRTRFSNGPAGSTFEMEYRSKDQKDWMNLFFLDGRFTHYSVARMGTGDDAQAQQHWRSPSAWAKVKPRMTLQEVEDLLGKPTAKSYTGGALGVQETLSAWLYDMSPEGTDPATGMVLFVGGVVLSITSPLFPVN